MNTGTCGKCGGAVKQVLVARPGKGMHKVWRHDRLVEGLIHRPQDIRVDEVDVSRVNTE